MIIAEMNIDVTDETGAYDFLAELEGMLEQEEEEIEDEVTTGDEEHRHYSRCFN
jgi:C4-type Zn-finger protein